MNYKYWTRPRHSAGFTLVELMVALVIVSLLTSIIYGLFIRTSDSMNEVDSLADTINKTRFALEHVRTDLQIAGAQASPNSLIDPNVRPEAKDRPVIGIVPYKGWQNKRDSVLTDETIRNENPNVSFDGFVVFGAYDYSQAFQVGIVAGEAGAPPTAVLIGNNERGVSRLVVNNPFFLGSSSALSASDDRVTAIVANMENRLLRITDRDGFNQFLPITGATMKSSGLELTFPSGALRFRQDGEMYGFERTSLADERYEAALIDAYWYHVVPVDGEPGNTALVRERLNAQKVMEDLGTGQPVLGDVPDQITSLVLATRQQTVITDRVVDFQIWFDCADSNGVIQQASGDPLNWTTGWTVPDGTAAPHDCVAPDDPVTVQRARVAHIRLSLRTENERPNRPHLKLGAEATWGFGEIPNTPLQTFDIAPGAVGAAQVVTLQSSVPLTNYALRGLR